MTKPIARDPIYRGRKFQFEIIELCVRWYLTYRLSYRDLVAMMAERNVNLSHSALGVIGKYRLRSCGALLICKFTKRRTSLFMHMFDSGSAGTSMSFSIGGPSPVSWRLPSD
jgi:hypothetical protein